MRITPSFRLIATFPIVLFCALATAHDVRAQGTENIIADPITSAEFDVMVQRLRLDYTQRLRAEAAHEEYKVRYQGLREKEIDALITSMYRMQSMFQDTMPKKEDIEDFLRQRQAVVERIDAADRDLFRAAGEILGDETSGSLARARRQRERDTYTAMDAPFEGTNVDLVDILYEMELPDDAWAAVDPTVTEYEISSNAALRSLHDRTMDMFSAMFEALEELGMDTLEPDFEDPERMAEYGRLMQEAMERVSKDVQEASKRAQSITESSRTMIARMLPVEHQEQFEDEYLHRAYPNIYSDWESPERMLKASIKLEDITDEQRDRLESIHTTWKNSYTAIQKRYVALEESRSEDVGAMFDASGEYWQQYWEKQQVIQQERSALNQRARDDALEALGEEIGARVSHLQGPEHLADDGTMAMDVQIAQQVGATISAQIVQGEMTQTGTDDLSVPMRGVDHMLPAAMTEAEYTMFLDRLGLTADQRVLAEDFHRAYREAYDALQSNELQTLVVQPQQAMWQEGGAVSDSYKQLNDGRTEALSLILAIEDNLFSDLDYVLQPEQRERLPQIRTARERTVYDIGASGSMGFDRDWVDFGRLILALQLNSDQMHHLHDALSDYEAKIVPVLKSLHGNLMRSEQAQSEARELMEELTAQGGDQMNSWQEYSRMIEPYQREAEELNDQRAQIEGEAKDGIIAVLPPQQAEEFRNRYNRFTYPDVYPDRDDAQPAVASAFQVTDLSPQQAEDIALIDQDHRDRYREICDEMMALSDSSAGGMPQWMGGGEFDIEAMMEWQRRESRLEILRFLRTEWNATTKRRIRASLTEEQAMQVRGM